MTLRTPTHASMASRMTATLLVVVLACVSPTRVDANHDGVFFGSTRPCSGTPTNCISVGNNNVHRIYFNNLTSNISNALSHTMANDYAPTDLFMLNESVYANRDVSAMDSTFGTNGAAGWVVCLSGSNQGTDAHGHAWCQSSLYFNLTYTTFYSTPQQRDYVTCHELGHTLGLSHHTGSCMQYRCCDGNGLGTLNSSDVQHLNAEY